MARNTEDLIVDAALQLFAERGYPSTTTRAIAERAGVNEVTLFRKFGTKRGILEAIGTVWTERASVLAADAMSDPADTRATIESLARLELVQASQFGRLVMRLVLDARFDRDIAEVMAAGPRQSLADVADYLAERQAAGDLRPDIDPRVMAEAFFALTSQAVMSREAAFGSVDPPYDLSFEAASAQLLEILMSGIGGRH